MITLKKNRTLNVFLLFIICVLITSCNSKPTNNKVSEEKTISIEGISNLVVPEGIEQRNDIPFVLLVDKEFKKNLPDTTNYELYRPNFILLQKGFNEKDSTQLASFPSITIYLYTKSNGEAFVLGNETINQLLNSINSNWEKADYSITDWKKIDTNLVCSDGNPGFEAEYTIRNRKTNKEMKIINLYVLKNGKLLNITMSAPNDKVDEWTGYYDSLIKNIK